MKPDDVATAITNALVQGGAKWLMATIVAFLPGLWTMTLMLHLGRPYVLRTLRRCGLRLGADVWWMSYLLMRDALLLVTFALSWIFFAPNEVQSAALPITGPVAALFLLLALAVKLVRRVDDDVSAYRWSTAFLVVGATLYYLPQVFAIEANSQPRLSWLVDTFTSSSHPTAALWIMWVSLAGVIVIAGGLALRLIQHADRTMGQRLSTTRPKTPSAAAHAADD
ncbi:MAG TPA: hypothetical protein VMU89_04625 [Thermomicrobiaceae bacterium]|nr:hypothetical protein [Thermomicrobiaceae bacterium]